MDGYRESSRRGKTLNEDQLAAVSKYEEVLQTLEFARELRDQFKAMSQEDEKQRKKQQKKELVEKAKGETKKVASILEMQAFLQKFVSLSKPVKSDFLNGTNGAPKLTRDQLDSIFELTNQTLTQKSGGKGSPNKETNGAASDKEGQMEFNYEKSAEHLTGIVDGKPKKVNFAFGNKPRHRLVK